MSVQITLADGGVLDVGAWPLPQGVEDGIVNRAQLSIAFSVSENTITKWIQIGMPVLSAGQNGVSYEFKLSHCWAWKQSRDDEARAAKRRGDQLAAQAAMAFRNLDADAAEDEADLTAGDVRAWSEAEYARNRVAEQRGDLVRADRVQVVLEDLLVGFRTAITTLPDWAEVELGLDAPAVAHLQTRCDEILKDARTEAEKIMPRQAQVILFGADNAQQEMGL